MNSNYYFMLQNAIAFESCLYQAYTILGDQQKAIQSYKKILRKERTLSLMRTNRLASKSVD